MSRKGFKAGQLKYITFQRIRGLRATELTQQTDMNTKRNPRESMQWPCLHQTQVWRGRDSQFTARARRARARSALRPSAVCALR
jgi:hypothetical protein